MVILSMFSLERRYICATTALIGASFNGGEFSGTAISDVCESLVHLISCL